MSKDSVHSVIFFRKCYSAVGYRLQFGSSIIVTETTGQPAESLWFSLNQRKVSECFVVELIQQIESELSTV